MWAAGLIKDQWVLILQIIVIPRKSKPGAPLAETKMVSNRLQIIE